MACYVCRLYQVAAFIVSCYVCRYHVRCDEPNSYMSVTLQDLDVEAASGQCGSENACLDFVKLQYPTGI